MIKRPRFSIHSIQGIRRPANPFLLLDEFPGNQAAPLTSPRTCEPGPGTLTIVDASNTLSISGGEIVPVAQSSGAFRPIINEVAGFARIAGRTLLARLKANGAFGSGISPNVGWANITNASSYGNVYQLIWRTANSAFGFDDLDSNAEFISTITACLLDTYYNYAGVLRSTGIFHFIDRVLQWVSVFGNEATMFPFVACGGANRYNFNLQYFIVRDFGSAFASDYGIATLHQTNPVDGTNYVGEADAISDLYFTLPGVPAAGNQLEMRYRVQDASNYWTAYVKRNAGNTAWDVLLDSVVAGTPTNRITVTGVGSPSLIRVIHDGTKHNLYTLEGTTWTKRGLEFSLATPMDAISSIKETAGTGVWTVSQLDVFPRRSTLYNVL